MTAVSLLRDLAAFSVQVAIVVVVVAALLRVLRIPARPRYLVLRLTLLACLLVPWTLRSVVVVTEAPAGAAALQLEVPSAREASASPAPTPALPTETGQPRALPDLPWATLGLVTLIAGVTARALWLAIGFLRLGQLTRRAVPVESAEYATVQEQLGTAAAISEVDRLAQPVTFGFRRPVVLLPDSLAVAPASLRRAVVTHELFHVRRGDWVSLLGEEAVRTVLWFHPAIHWLTSSIQLAREEMVDELTVRATGDRRAYMQALLAFADTGGLRTAPAFAHRRQLFHRILSVSKEKVMSAPRIVMSVAALVLGVSAASWYASTVFPILTASRIELPAVAVPPVDDGWLIAEPQFVTVAGAGKKAAVNGYPDRVREVPPENPSPGQITERQSGSEPAGELQLAEWMNYVRETQDSLRVLAEQTRGIAVVDQDDFNRQLRAADEQASREALRRRVEELRNELRELERAFRLASGRSPENQDLARYQAELARMSDNLAELQRSMASTREQASEISPAARLAQAAEALRADRAAQEAARAADAERAARDARVRALAERGLIAPSEAQRLLAQPANERPLVSPSGRAPIRIDPARGIKGPAVTKSVKPEHPLVAMQARVSGTVVLEALVDEQGRVADARVIKSIPLLDRAALDAAKLWEFTPTVVNGEAVPVLVMLEMNFALK
jgi:TonB family protein